ncbi:hypothetical protein P3T76_013909 [Phytophthora citrophthora]|uniref:Uncharacterized protein n=1 Tax=Phytophthora citrophthora TaxID=4793 RepID=A0AAD9G265_9STRA|nr:hypothetical protein P3T76_013909 [Phytophthora citrophthora]
MSFLLGDDYASSSSSSESDEETITSRTDNKELKEQEGGVVQLLPSADSVLSSVSASTASFLPPKSSSNAQTTIKSFDLIEERNRQLKEEEKEAQVEKETDRTAETGRIERKRPMPAARQEAAKREKKEAKERVKNQRVKGQAGIGSDFRGWKSETEMALRQQFD